MKFKTPCRLDFFSATAVERVVEEVRRYDQTKAVISRNESQTLFGLSGKQLCAGDREGNQLTVTHGTTVITSGTL
jgi:hypothetical protein